MTKKKTKKRSPTDSTMRNVRAANKRIKELEARVTLMEDFAVRVWKHLKGQLVRL